MNGHHIVYLEKDSFTKIFFIYHMDAKLQKIKTLTY